MTQLDRFLRDFDAVQHRQCLQSYLKLTRAALGARAGADRTGLVFESEQFCLGVPVGVRTPRPIHSWKGNAERQIVGGLVMSRAHRIPETVG
jgi:hypothetical protein